VDLVVHGIRYEAFDEHLTAQCAKAVQDVLSREAAPLVEGAEIEVSIERASSEEEVDVEATIPLSAIPEDRDSRDIKGKLERESLQVDGRILVKLLAVPAAREAAPNGIKVTLKRVTLAEGPGSGWSWPNVVLAAAVVCVLAAAAVWLRQRHHAVQAGERGSLVEMSRAGASA